MPSALAIMALLVTPMLSHGQVVPAFFLRLTSAVIPFTPPAYPPMAAEAPARVRVRGKNRPVGKRGVLPPCQGADFLVQWEGEMRGGLLL